MKAFVTGGTGFIGERLVRRLRDRGDDVVALVRSREKGATLEQLGAQLVLGDLSSSDSIRSGLEGCDAAFHAAAVYKVGIPEKEHEAMYDANVRGTERVLDAAFQAGVSRIVYVSTINVFGNTRGETVDESYERPGDDFVSYYDETKYLVAPGRQRPDREGRADRDRAAGRRIRPGRPLRGRQRDRPDQDRQASGAAVRRARPEPGLRGRRGRRPPARARPRPGGRVVRSRR